MSATRSPAYVCSITVGMRTDMAILSCNGMVARQYGDAEDRATKRLQEGEDPMPHVERSTTIPADTGRVWDAIVRGDWLGDELELKALPGGDGVVLVRGEVRHVGVERVDPGHQFVHRWWPLSEDGVGDATRVTIDVEPEDEQTRVVVTEIPALPAPMP